MRQTNLPVGLRFKYKTSRLGNHSKALLHKAKNINKKSKQKSKKKQKHKKTENTEKAVVALMDYRGLGVPIFGH